MDRRLRRSSATRQIQRRKKTLHERLKLFRLKAARSPPLPLLPPVVSMEDLQCFMEALWRPTPSPARQYWAALPEPGFSRTSSTANGSSPRADRLSKIG